MTADDMIAAISATYGIATRPNAEIAYHSNYAEVAPVIARWQDSAVLVQSGAFRLWRQLCAGDVLETTGCFGDSRDNRSGSTGRGRGAGASNRSLAKAGTEDSDSRLRRHGSVNAPNFQP